MLKPIKRHHNKLPQLGAIGYIAVGRGRYGHFLWWNGKPRRCLVESYPLLDYRGCSLFHCINVRFLDNNERKLFSAIYFREIENLSTPTPSSSP